MRLAVVDGPHGTSTFRVPGQRAEALEARARFRGDFWCSTVAGGCGGRLRLHAGAVLRPYFQHHADAGSCSLAGDAARAERSYEHVRYQHALLAWLAGQGLSGRAEHSMGADGRADLHVIVDEAHHSIEVQLSPLGTHQWATRDEKYRQSMDHVTWLYGHLAEPAAATEQALRGVALLLRRDDVDDVGVGTRGPGDTTWSPLADCRLTADGFWTPHLEAAWGAHAEEQRDRERDEEEAPRQEPPRLVRVTPDTSKRPAEAAPAARPTVRWPGSIARWRDIHPEAEEWAELREWLRLEGVEEPARSAVRHLAYLTQCIYFNGPTAMFDLPDVPDLERALRVLERAGLIHRYERSGVQRWERGAAAR